MQDSRPSGNYYRETRTYHDVRHDERMTNQPQNRTFWQRLLAENDRWLRTSLDARLRDPHAVDEVMQEVAVAAFANGEQLRDVEKAGPWLYRIAIRQSLLYRRNRGRQRALSQRYFDRVRRAPEYEEDGAAWLLAMERNALVRQALDELPARDAEMLMLKYCEGWSYQQIADRIGVSVSAVESRLHRARRRLRGRLTAMGVVEVSG